MVFYGRTILNSFGKHKSYPGLEERTGINLEDRMLTPTATAWSIGLSGSTQDDLNNDHVPTPTITEIKPTQTPWIITATPGVTQTPTPTPTPWYEGMYIPPSPGIAKYPDREHDLIIRGKISFYYPPYAYDHPDFEINCNRLPSGELDCEHLASGEKTRHYIGEAVACPPKFEFGTVMKIWDGYYTCRDRGGAIDQIGENLYWLDILFPHMPLNKYWGEETEVYVWLP